MPRPTSAPPSRGAPTTARAPPDLPPTANVITPSETLSRCTAKMASSLRELELSLPPQEMARVGHLVQEMGEQLQPLQQLQKQLRSYSTITSSLWRTQRENAALKEVLESGPVHRPPPTLDAPSRVGSAAYAKSLTEIRELHRKVEEQERLSMILAGCSNNQASPSHLISSTRRTVKLPTCLAALLLTLRLGLLRVPHSRPT